MQTEDLMRARLERITHDLLLPLPHDDVERWAADPMQLRNARLIQQSVIDNQRSGRLVLDQKRGTLHVESAPVECVKCFSDELTIEFQWWGERKFDCLCRTCGHVWEEILTIGAGKDAAK